MSTDMAVAVTSSSTSRWKPYPAYKDSGVEWLGEIPEYWDVLPFRRGIEFLTDFEANGSFATIKENVKINVGKPFAWYVRATDLENVRFGFNKDNHFCDITTFEFLWKTKLEGGNLLVTKRGEIGKVYLMPKVDIPATLGPNLYLIHLNNYLFAPFTFYWFSSNFGKPQLVLMNKSTTIGAIYKDDIKNCSIIYPPLQEQRAITSFLNRETARIDTLISKKERLISLLQEKRAALISHAVTKGLDLDVPMKESEIPTIGKIPSHWKVKRNKQIFKEINERSTTGTEELLTVSHITGVTPRSEKNVNMFMAESLEGYKRCRQNDLIINTMWAWMGALGVSKQKGIVSPSYNVYRLINEKKYQSKYLDFLYRTPSYICEITRHSKGVWSSRLRLYPDSFFEICTIEPPLSEQQQILEYIYMKIQKTDIFLEKLKESIEKLREYRTALISAAVTGKIDVRNGDY